MLQGDKPFTLNPGTPTANLRRAELHYQRGLDKVLVDVFDDKGQEKRITKTLSGAQQAQLTAIIDAIVKSDLGITTITDVPDPVTP